MRDGSCLAVRLKLLPFRHESLSRIEQVRMQPAVPGAVATSYDVRRRNELSHVLPLVFGLVAELSEHGQPASF